MKVVKTKKKKTHKTNGFGVNVKIHLTNRYVIL